MKKKEICRRFAAWTLTFAMVFGNGSFGALAAEDYSEAPAAQEQTAPETAEDAAGVSLETVPEAANAEEVSPEAAEADAEAVSAEAVSLDVQGDTEDAASAEAAGFEEASGEEPLAAEEEAPAEETELWSGDIEEAADPVIDEEALDLNLTEEVTVEELLELEEDGEADADQEGTYDRLYVSCEYYGEIGDGYINSWLYPGQSQTYYINEADDYEIKWKAVDDIVLEQYDINFATDLETVATLADSDKVILAQGQDETSVIVTAKAKSDYTDDGRLVVGLVALVYEEDTIAAYGVVPIVLRDQVYEYSYPLSGPGENQMLPGDSVGIGHDIYCWVEDAEHPDGDEIWTQITDVAVTGQYTWDDDAEDGWVSTEETVVRAEQDEDGDWALYGETFGYADIEISYVSVETGEEEAYQTEVYVNGDVFSLGWEFQTGSDQMLVGDATTVYFTMYHGYLNDDNNRMWEEVPDFALSAVDDEGNPAYDSEIISVEVEGQELKIRALQDGGTSIHIRAFLDGEEVADRYVWTNVTGGYWNLTPLSLDAVMVGETLDLNAVPWSLVENYTDEDGNPQQYKPFEEKSEDDACEYRVRLESYNEDIWEADSSESELLPSLKRIGDWDDQIIVVAERTVLDEDGNLCLDDDGEVIWEEVCRRDDLWVDGLDYSIWCEKDGEETDNTWVYTDEEAVLTLNTENLEDNNGVVEVLAGGWVPDGEEDEEGNPSYTVESNDLWTEGYAYDAEAGTVTLYGSVLGKIRDANEGEGFVLYFAVKAGDLEPYTLFVNVDVRDPEFWSELTDVNGEHVLPGSDWDFGINKYFGCWINNSDYPDGQDLEGVITAIEVENHEEDGPADAVTLEEWEDEEGWTIQPREFGQASVIVTYDVYCYDEEGNKTRVMQDQTHSFEVYVQGSHTVVYPRPVSSTDTDQILPGSSLDLQALTWWWEYDEEIGTIEKDTSDFTFEWRIEEGEDVVSITPDPEDSSVLHVTANENMGGESARISVSAYYADPEDPEGKPEEMAYGDYWVNVTDEYLQVIAETVYARPGETVSIEDVSLALKYFSLETPEGEDVPVESFEFEVNDYGYLVCEEPSSFQVVSDIEEEEFPIYTGLTVIARTEDGEEIRGGCNVRICVHQWKTEEKAATCTEPGFTKSVCTVCGYTEEEVIPAKGHTLTVHSAAAATCTAAGNIAYWSCSVCGKNFSDEAGTKEVAEVAIPAKGHTPGAWTVTTAATCTTAGTQVKKCTVCGAVLESQSIPAKGHTWSAYKTVSAATVFAAETQQRTCSVCGAADTRTVGTKLTPTMTLTANSLKMKTKQSTTQFKVTGMAAGDSLVSVTSSNTKVVKASKVKAAGTFKLKAQNKTGKATLTIKLASGLTKTVKVTVQSSTVKTTKISGLSKKLTIKKGKKATLTPVITPITSQQKVTYKTSNSKVATVTAKGVIKAKKAGKAKITVTSGSKKYVVTVTVK